MKVVVQSNVGVLRRSMSFSTSGIIHGAILAYVAFGTMLQHAAPRQSLYDQEIRPHEKKLVWYHVAEKLPEIRPPRPEKAAARPLRATRTFHQEIVAGARDDARPPQLVWAPAPEAPAPKPQPLPNVVAVEQKTLTRAFTPPPQKTVPMATPALPDAPQAAGLKTDSKLPIEAERPKALVREFQRPSVKAAALTLPALPDAPQVAGTVSGAAAAIDGAGLKPLVKPFTPPSAPARKVEAAPAPDLPTVTGPLSQTPQLAIVGLDPAKLTAIPPAPPPRDANFSAGPKPRPDGASSDGAGAALSVPGLTVRGTTRDSQPSVVPKLGPLTRESMLANMRGAMPPPPGEAPRTATHIAAAPDPILEGRVVYTVAIQMPNVTSFSGSWIVWFAEREPAPGAAAADVRAPSPLRKVDPKYVASAAADRVEGTVRLSAIIRKTGQVDTVTLLRHLDERLDRSAMESLAKWVFEPARRNGTPIDVDAVFEIPFRLAPKPVK
jgi:TonB family protein